MSAPHQPGAARREIAITFDDLPAVSVTRGDLEHQRAITAGLVRALMTHDVPAVGFVVEKKLLTNGDLDQDRVDLLHRWLDAGLELGNHTFSHKDLHATPAAAYAEDIVRGEIVTRGLLRERGLPLRYFRHPYLRTGTDLATKLQVEGMLFGRGCRVAPVTIYNEDYLFAAALDRARERGDRGAARRVTRAYVHYLERQAAYYERLSRRLLGYELRQILVLHANSINAEMFGEIAEMLQRRGYAFVTLARALEDPAYAVADPYVRPEGISWLQRWAINAGHGESFLAGEPETPWFVRVHSGEGREGVLVRGWSRALRARDRLWRASRRRLRRWLGPAASGSRGRLRLLGSDPER
jgi:peptidoglycan/xylan/chitin deacetylase (PgdA/CDA1 family)